MNKNLVKLIFCMTLSILFVSANTFAASTGKTYRKETYKYNKIPIRQPVITKSMVPAVNKYNSGDYLGAMIDLKELVEKREPNNTYAKYYIALSYTQLGYKSEAQQYYQSVIDDGSCYSLSYYSRRALTCIDNPENEICKPPKKPTIPEPVMSDNDDYQSGDDITNFIRSGKTIHPVALDKITRERAERKLQADLYSAKEAQKNLEAENNQ